MFGLFVQYSDADKKAAELLKKASDIKGKDINTAIDLLKKAYFQINKTDISYPISTFLRLPMYLQEANRTEEAIEAFNDLLINGYPNQQKDKSLIIFDKSHIYDKMRLFYQREKRPQKAVSYGIYSYLCDALGRHYQKRYEEINLLKDKNFIIEKLIPLLKKAKRLDLPEDTYNIVINELNNLPDISSFEAIDKKLNIIYN